MPMSGAGGDGDARSRRDEQDEPPMSIHGKGYRGSGSRPKTHIAADADRWDAENVGREATTLTALIAYNYGNDSQGANMFYPKENGGRGKEGWLWEELPLREWFAEVSGIMGHRFCRLLICAGS